MLHSRLFGMQHDCLQKKTNWSIDSTPGVENVRKRNILATMLVYASFSVIVYAKWPYS